MTVYGKLGISGGKLSIERKMLPIVVTQLGYVCSKY